MCLFTSQAQLLTRSNNTLVVANGFELPKAWAGGFNAPQFSTIDVNGDGLKDIFTFDRIGARISIFLNTGTINGQTYYSYTREFNDSCPDGLVNWVLLRDFNCDGKEDIFANSQSQIKCWKNVSASGVLAFEPVNNGSPIQADYDFGNPFTAPIYTVSVDIPAIEDYDGDGDLDIFTFTEQATTIYFFKSLQAENGNCETMDYVCGNRCYGMFGESPESFSMILGSDFICGLNVTEPRSNEMLHTGGTLCSIDLDNNGLHDLVVGDVTETNLGALLMENAWDGLDSVIAFQNDFPLQQGATVQVNLPLFPAAYYEDVTADGIRDLIVAPNSYSAMDDRNGVWMYKNNGANAGPQFEFQSTNFLQNEMIDFGTCAYPVLTDVNADGLKDLMVTNRKYFNPFNWSDSHTSRIYYFQNTGTAEIPSFELMTDNYLPLETDTLDSKYLAFGDDDGDGDEDMLIGVMNGYLFRYENTAGQGNAMQFSVTPETLTTANGTVIDVGQYAAPQWVDLNEDGLLDLAVGEKNGNVNYFQNVGTANAPAYNFIEDSLGHFAATNIIGVFGYSIPHFYKNGQNQWEVLVGTETGQINHYSVVDGNLNGNFNLETLDFYGINEGERCAVWYEDITADGLPDLFVGQIGGGLGFYTSDSIISVSEIPNLVWNVYPNPTVDEVVIQLQSGAAGAMWIEVLDSQGRFIDSQKAVGNSIQISMSDCAPGVYFIRLNGREVQRVVKLER
jgi:hypothetical protein